MCSQIFLRISYDHYAVKCFAVRCSTNIHLVGYPVKKLRTGVYLLTLFAIEIAIKTTYKIFTIAKLVCKATPKS